MCGFEYFRIVITGIPRFTAYRPFLALALGIDDRVPVLGPQPERVGSTRLFVVPNPSPANAHFTLADQTVWYDRLADFLGEGAIRGAPCPPGAPSGRTARR